MSKRSRRQVSSASRPPGNRPLWTWAAFAILTVAAALALAATMRRTPPPDLAPEAMVWIPGGEFSMGAADPVGDEANEVGMQATLDSRPIHRVSVDGFWMDATEVTNKQFAAFVKATGYVTVAERTPRAEDFPGALPENLVAWPLLAASLATRKARRLRTIPTNLAC